MHPAFCVPHTLKLCPLTKTKSLLMGREEGLLLLWVKHIALYMQSESAKMSDFLFPTTVLIFCVYSFHSCEISDQLNFDIFQRFSECLPVNLLGCSGWLHENCKSDHFKKQSNLRFCICCFWYRMSCV